MSFFTKIFGGAKQQPALSANQGLEQLEEKADMLRKRITHLQEQIKDQENIAKQYANTNKIRALGALKKKKQLEENLKKAEGTLDNLESQRDMLENASSNAAVLKTMADTAKIVKQQHSDLDINKVEDIVDEMREQQEISEEIANILSQTTGKTHDEGELEDELRQLQQEELDKQLLNTKDMLPETPTVLPEQPTSSKKDEEELDELKKWASAAQ